MIEKILNLLSKIPKDKSQHGFYGTLIYSVFLGLFIITGIQITIAGLASFLLTLLLAVTKEIYDAKYPNHTVDVYDTIATVIIPIILTIDLYLYYII